MSVSTLNNEKPVTFSVQSTETFAAKPLSSNQPPDMGNGSEDLRKNARAAAYTKLSEFQRPSLWGSAGDPPAAAQGPDTPFQAMRVRRDAPTASAPLATGAGSSSASANGQPVASSNVQTGKTSGPDIDEELNLLDKYAPQPGESANLPKMQSLQRLTLRAADPGDVQFEASQQRVSAKIADLPQRQQSYYRGAQAGFLSEYEAADTSEKRQDIRNKFESFQNSLSDTHELLHEQSRHSCAKRVSGAVRNPVSRQ